MIFDIMTMPYDRWYKGMVIFYMHFNKVCQTNVRQLLFAIDNLIFSYCERQSKHGSV